MTTWVLLRGLMRESRHWGKFPALFQNALGAQKVVALDFPGNGKLHTQASPTSVEEMTNHIRSQLKQLGCTPPFHVLALSLGAMVAVEWSERYPDELDRMILINTSMAPYNPFYQRLRPANYPALILHLFLGSAVQRERLILKLTSRLTSRTEYRHAILHQWVDYAREYPVTRANILRQLLAAIRYRAGKAVPPAPVLLLAAQKDELVNSACSLALAKNWHCAIKLHPAAGHDLPLDDGIWVAQQVKGWLDDGYYCR
jgi:pimeloyl-ACP methyl ester carboxylesterase